MIYLFIILFGLACLALGYWLGYRAGRRDSQYRKLEY